MQTQQEDFNNGLYMAAQKYQHPVAAELEEINRRCELERAAKAALPVPIGHYEPIKSPAEAIAELAKPVGILAFVAGGVWVVIASAAAVAAAVMAFVAQNAVVIGGGAFAVALIFGAVATFRENAGGDSRREENSATAQNINVTVNIGGRDASIK